MPTGKQVRAARVLAGWEAQDLADKAGLNRETVFKVERGTANPKPETVERIVRTFAEEGIEFTDNEGVRRRPQGVEIFEGPERFEEFYDFLYHHMLEHGGEVCLSVVDEKLLAKYRRNPEVQRQRMRELVKAGRITYSVLVTVGDFTGDYVAYRQQPAHAAAPTAFYAFGECLALISFPPKNSPHVVVIRSEPLTQAYRQSFHAAWEKAVSVSQEEIKKIKSKI
ncbi:MAG: helix-turn-helix transcriptional regulator [Alphaproteobacteria bacterium]|nr:helix-turn-helix transcriptional regulator [Alphaproteobacteria bacterium]